MRQKHPENNKLLEALRALVSDMEGMYQGKEYCSEHEQIEEFFGPFSVSRMVNAGADTVMSISWPNLAISMRNAMTAIRAAEADDESDRQS